MGTPDATGPSVFVDASVGLKWLLAEAHSASALTLLNKAMTLHVPDLFYVEIGNVLWKRVRAVEITAEKAIELMDWLATLPLVVHQTRDLMGAAIEIACRHHRAVYDSLYVALAVREGCLLVTADEKMVNSLAGTPLAASILLIQNIGEVGQLA